MYFHMRKNMGQSHHTKPSLDGILQTTWSSGPVDIRQAKQYDELGEQTEVSA